MGDLTDPGDPFGTGGIRDRVLRSWTASPARFREDANAEEDYALGGYRDRVVIELAQNAADAAARTGRPGRVLFRLAGGVLDVANTGAPLDAAGVLSLSTLRASEKRDDERAVGRFGVGFAAVAAVSDEPVIVSTTGAVTWSARRARELVAAVPALAGELERRGGAVPLLRLPFAASGPAAPTGGAGPPVPAVPGGYDTLVRLPLRDGAAERLVLRLLDEVGPALLLALPALGEVTVEAGGAARTLTANRPDDTECLITAGGAEPVRWRTVTDGGAVDAALLADRPAEERTRPWWQVQWAVPLDAAGRPVPLPGGVPAVVHAPTPSAEPLDLPALLLAAFPLAPDRRHVAPGPLTDFVVDRAADAYVGLLRDLAAEAGHGGTGGARLLDLVPGPVAAGELDALIRRRVLARLPETPLLPAARDGGPVAGRDGAVVDGPPDLVRLLGEVLPGLLAHGLPVRHPALGGLRVRVVEPAEAVDALAGIDRPAAWWRRLYEALAGADPRALGALPVPLADGRTVRGPRGVLIATDGADPARLGALGLRFAHPEAVHPLLRRLGAADAGPVAILDDPATRAAVAASYDDALDGRPGEPEAPGGDEPLPAVAAAVLPLVEAAGLRPGDAPWLAELALPDAEGDLYPAGELLLPDGPLRSVMAADAPFGVAHPALVERFGAETLEAAGVLRTFALLRVEDMPLTAAGDYADAEDDEDAGEAGDSGDHEEFAGDEEWAQLDNAAGWVRAVLAQVPGGAEPPVAPELWAVRDLELVAPDRWPEALELLALPPLRAAVTEPAVVLGPDGRRFDVRSYTAWWLGRHRVWAGRRPADLRLPDADPLLDGLYDPAPAGVDAELARALGARTTLAALLAEPGGPDDLLARLADPVREVGRGRLRELWTALAAVEPDRLTPPDRVRALCGGVPEVVPADDVMVADAPDLLPLLSGQPLLLVPAALAGRLADLLDVALAGEEVPGAVESTGRSRPVPPAVRAVLPGAPETYLAHDRLVVDGREVGWRSTGGVVHAAGDAGLARGLAWACGRWERRFAAEAALRDPGSVTALLDETDLERP